MAKETNKVSSYKLLNQWLYDGSRTSKLPEQVLTDYSIGPQYVLYFFRGSPYLQYISEVFNNYYIFQMPKDEVFRMLKDIVRKTSFRPSYFKPAKKSKIKLVEALRKKYPILKINDVNFLATLLEDHEDYDLIQQCLGLKKGVKKTKTTKKTKKEYSSLLEKTETVEVQEVEQEDDAVMEVDAEQAIKELEEAFDAPVSFENLLEHFDMEV